MSIPRIDFTIAHQTSLTTQEVCSKISEVLSIEIKPLFSDDEWLIHLIDEFKKCASQSSFLPLRSQLLSWSITNNVCIEGL
jgi:hypothetical protein